MSLLVLGLNHKTASVEVREQASLVPEQINAFLETASLQRFVDEVVVLSTCNRTEFYLKNLRVSQSEFIDIWAAHSNLKANEIYEYLYELREEEMVYHLFEVASGLDSLVLGEPQIFGQLKQALATAVTFGTVHKFLQKLFQLSFHIAKKVRTETDIGMYAVSVAFTAVQLAKQIFDGLESQRVLLVGAGETTELVARHLLDAGVVEINVVNRTAHRAQLMLENLGLKRSVYTLEMLPPLMAEADIIISSTAAEYALIDKTMVKQALKVRKNRPILMIDLAVPRDIDEKVGKLSDIYLYTVDDLHTIVEDNQRSREKAAIEAKRYLNEGVKTWQEWKKRAHLSRVMLPLQAYAVAKKNQGIQKAKNQLAHGKEIDLVLEQLSNQLLGRVLHPLLEHLKIADERAHASFIRKIEAEYKQPE